ncbi:MAG: hypothetical protein DI527_23935 [Chelatococcus sp.]|nr:MAG: hypothetical protein DI527_23935 [Chelatococcus sp.]
MKLCLALVCCLLLSACAEQLLDPSLSAVAPGGRQEPAEIFSEPSAIPADKPVTRCVMKGEDVVCS